MICLKKTHLFLLLYFILVQAAFADEQRWTALPPNTLQLKGGLFTPGLDFTLKTLGTDYVFIPESQPAFFGEVSLENLSLGLRLSAPDEKQSTTPSSVRDFQFRFFGHKWTYEVIYQRFKGYTLDGWQDNGTVVYRPDVGVENFSINTIYNFSDHKYSPAVAYDQKGIQIERGGALLSWGSVGRTRLFADTSLIPLFAPQDAGEIQTLSGIVMDYALFGLGYGYTYPFLNRFYFTTALFLGYGIQTNTTSFVDQAQERKWNSIYRVGVRPGLGYNHGSHTAGLQLMVDSNSAAIRDSEFQQATFATQLFYGYRFSQVSLPFLDSLKSTF